MNGECQAFSAFLKITPAINLKKIEIYLLKNTDKSNPVILCVSGGKDSSAMLRGFSKIRDGFKFPPLVVHFNHGLRRESMKEEGFVRSESQKAGFPFLSVSLDVKGRAGNEKMSVEEAARSLRYEKLEDITEKKGGEGTVFTAHTASDQAETLLLRFIKGAGFEGLQGIRKEYSLSSGWKVRRPFLGFTSADIMDYLEVEGVDYVVDKSNFNQEYERNYIRHRIIPRVKKLNPSIEKALAREADIFTEHSRFISDVVSEKLKDIKFGKSEDRRFIELTSVISYNTSLQREILRRVSPVEMDYEKTAALIELIKKEGVFASVDLGEGWIARKEYKNLYFEKGRPGGPEYCYRVKTGKKELIKETGVLFSTCVINSEEIEMPPAPGVEYFDAEALKADHLIIRSKKPGDRMSLLGMKGSKKVKDILIDEKITAWKRRRLLIVEAHGSILWAAPYKRSGCFPLTENTKKVLKMRVSDG